MDKITAEAKTEQLLRELGFSPRHIGFRVLCVAIPRYAEDDAQSLTKELYPGLRQQFGYTHPTAIERPIRYAITRAWNRGRSDVWQKYFPRASHAPSNWNLIAALAEQIR